MFDILTDVWTRPGASHSPIVPLDVSHISDNEAESLISILHKYGLDSLLLTCDGTVDAGVLDKIFAAASKRFMLVFVHESVITADIRCTDEFFVSYNPMLRAHTLRLSKSSETTLAPFEEICASYYVKRDGAMISFAEQSVDNMDEYEKLDIILTEADSGIDLLSPEAGEMFVSVYEAFYEKYKSIAGASFVGIMSSRLKNYSPDTPSWSYDMTEEFNAKDGTPCMLLSLLAETDKRSRKEGRRIFGKTLASRLDRTYLTPVSEWCGKNSLAFMGEVPYDFIGTCARRFTLPVYSDDCFEGTVTTDSEKMSALQCLADTARGEGFTGAVYRCNSLDADSLVREAARATAASASLILLTAEFSSPEFLDSVGIRRDDMKRLTYMLRRLSTLNTSCTSDTSCAVLCDDGFIPFAGTDKLRELGVNFNFLPLPQAADRGHSHDGEFLLDRFRYTSFLIDQRVRMEVQDVKQIGEAAAYGAKLYRGGQFGDFAKKHLGVCDFDREFAGKFIVRHTVKCGHRFTFIVNISYGPVKLKYPQKYPHAAYVLDAYSGGVKPLLSAGNEETYEELRISAGGIMTIAWDFDVPAHVGVAEASQIREIHALHSGENTVCFNYSDGDCVQIELDSFDGYYADVQVNGCDAVRIIAPPYSVDISDKLTDGENKITVSCAGKIYGAVLRLF